MKIDEIVTKQDLLDFEKRIKYYIQELRQELNNVPYEEVEYIRTRDVKKLLKLSDNTLKSLRENGDLPFSFIGKSYYYPKNEILEILKNNTININKTK